VGVIVAAALLLGAAAGARPADVPESPGAPWATQLARDHPLVGRIWAGAEQRFVEPAALIARLRDARFSLLGEKHDNPDHHRLQAWIVRTLVAAGQRPAVAFEMFTADDAEAIARHLAATPADAAGLGDAVGWSRSGWPPWPTYQPIAEAAVRAGLPIVAANLGRADTAALRQRGVAGLDPRVAARLGLDAPFPAPLQAALVDELRAAHCGHGDATMLERLALVQRARDAHMAAALVSAGERAVLIAGAGHTRRDRGVPLALARLAPGASVVVVAFAEVQVGEDAPEAYVDGTADMTWFTPRVDDRDPCEAFRVPRGR
jgi:uncharacterized iron-regulated protein